MKAKHITKLRKKAKLMQTYKIRESCGLFGFDTLRQFDFEEIKANSEFLAMKRFFSNYYKVMKKLHKSHEAKTITTHNWGKIEVVDKNGYSTYFK